MIARNYILTSNYFQFFISILNCTEQKYFFKYEISGSIF